MMSRSRHVSGESNLADRVQRLEAQVAELQKAPVASIGGAGTLDGIFLTGILAVLLAGLYHPRQTAWQP